MRAIARHRAASVLGVGPRAYRRIGAPAAAGREAAEERRGRVWCAANPSLQPSRCRPPIPPPVVRRRYRRRADGMRAGRRVASMICVLSARLRTSVSAAGFELSLNESD